MVTTDDVLFQLDKAQADYLFPDLGHGYSYLIDSRLRAFGDDGGRWALVVEVVGYNVRAGSVQDVLHYFGNCLTSGSPGYENDDFLDRIENFEELEDPEEPETYRGGTPISVRGQSIDGGSAEPGAELVDVFRSLVPVHRELLLADESELRRRIPADLPELLQLQEWRQPDLFEKLPSESEAYRLIAEAVAFADASRYRPTETPNTHWSNWPESGSL